VLHIDTERGWRGGQRQVLWLAQALDASRYRCLIAARPDHPLAIRARHAGVPVIPARPAVELDPVTAWSLRRAIIRHDVGVVHAHTGHAVALAALAARGTAARIVVTRRVDLPLRSNAVTRWKYGRASAVIAVSRAVADALVASGIGRARIEIVPSGVDLSRRVEPATPATLFALGVPSGAPLVVQVAQLAGFKDPVTFVEAVALARRQVPDLHALLVGDGPLRGRVLSAIARHGVQDAVHVIGYRTDADSLLAAADVVTLTSRVEGLGTVLLDALALGKPIAATAGGGIPEVIEDHTSGMLVPVGDAAALGAVIADLLLHPERRAALAAAARRRAEHFSIAHTAARTAAVYERVVQEPES
jgi:L-malate glycosyltransferase